MITLLDCKDFKQQVGTDGMLKGFIMNNDIGSMIREKLHLGWKNKELIYIQELRGVGKTYELVKLAKEFKFVVIVNNNGLAQKLRNQYEYNSIYGQMDQTLRKMQKCVIDENVDIENLLIDMECSIITGYTNNKNIKLHCSIDNDFITTNDDSNNSFSERVVKNLKEEINKLEKAKDKALASNNFSDYKLLINNYKEVVRLIQDMDYKLMYSEYGTTDSTGVMSKKQVAVWEQNGDGNIRNHKIWDIKLDAYKK